MKLRFEPLQAEFKLEPFCEGFVCDLILLDVLGSSLDQNGYFVARRRAKRRDGICFHKRCEEPQGFVFAVLVSFLRRRGDRSLPAAPCAA